MRGPQPAPKKPWDWVGLLVRSTRDLTTQLGSVPAGTLFVCSYSRSGLTIHSRACGKCGVSFTVSKVPITDVEAVFAPQCELPGYPSKLWKEHTTQIWEEWDWIQEQLREHRAKVDAAEEARRKNHRCAACGCKMQPGMEDEDICLGCRETNRIVDRYKLMTDP